MATQKPQVAPPKRFSFLAFFMIVWFMIFAYDIMKFRQTVSVIPYSQFISYVGEGRVSEVAVGNEKLEGKLKNPVPLRTSEFVTMKMEDPDLTKRLTRAGVRFSGFRESTFFRDLLSWVVPALLLFAIWGWVVRRAAGGAGARGGLLPMGKNKARVYVETDLKTRFEDVAGVEEAKEELCEIVNFLKDPTGYSRLGGRMPKGVLLIGPPGTGKTLLARAVAGEAGVAFYSINGSEFVELFVGLGAARVRDLFEQARTKAPCIIFIDELDALGKARGISALSGSANDEKEQTLNQLLAEMDGFDSSTGIIVVAATNRPEVLDPALLRAGRFDRQVLVDKPDRLGRKQILAVHLKKVKLSASVSTDTLASLTAGFSGADLANLVNEAALIATRRKAEMVELRDFTEAIERIVAGLERRTRVLNADEKRRVAYHEMGHALVALALGEDEAVHKVSIIPRGLGALGYTFRRPTEDRYLMSRKEISSKMAIAMGGRAAEEVFFNDISTGAADDLDKATEMARAMVTRYGMSPSLGLATYEKEASPLLGGQMRSHDYSERTAELIDQEIKRALNESHVSALNLVENHRAFIEAGAGILLTSETIDEHQLKDLWDKHRGEYEKTAPVRRVS